MTEDEAIKRLRYEDLKHPVKKLHALFRQKKLEFVRDGRSYLTRADWIDAYLMLNGSEGARRESYRKLNQRIAVA